MTTATDTPGLRSSHSLLELVLRVGVAACFIGHGAFGILGKQAWVPYFGAVGIPEPWAWSLMPVVGAIDILVGILALIVPVPAILAYMVVWGLWTATLRPIAGESVFEVLERAGNYGLPLAFLVATGLRVRHARPRDWFELARARVESAAQRVRVMVVLQVTTALLLVGHGGLALLGKPLLQQHLALLTARQGLLPWVGAGEIALGAMLLVRPHVALLAIAFTWKVGTEALYPLAGAPIWEFVERGGSYAAPLALLLLATGASARRLPAERLRPVAPAIALGSLSIAVVLAASAAWSASAVASESRIGDETLQRLRAGNLVFACRHALTDRSRGDDRRVRIDDPATQRVLSASGREQALRLGQVLVELDVPVGEVLASPYSRTAETAELAFGRVESTAILQYGNSREQQEGRERYLSEAPIGGNRVLFSHQGILYRMLPGVSRGSIREGDCVVTTSGPREQREVLGRFGPSEFAALGDE